MSRDAEPGSTPRHRVVTWLLLGLLLVLGVAYVAVYFVTSDRIPRGTTVAGVEVGGYSPVTAQRRLAAELEPRAERPIRVTAAGKRTSLNPAESGLSVDVPATVREAGGGRSWDPRQMWNYLFGGDNVDPVLTVDKTALDRAVDGFAKRVDGAPVEGRIVFVDGKARATNPTRGTVLDRDRSSAAIRSAFLDRPHRIKLPIATAEPQISKRAVSRAMSQFANPAMSGAVLVRFAGKRVAMQPADFAPALSMKPVGSELRPQLDAERLVAALRSKTRTIAGAPVDATVRLVNGRPRVIPGRTGVTFDPKDVTSNFLGVLTKSQDRRTLVAKSVIANPERTTAEARGLGVRERVSTFTTNFPYAAYRNVNLTRAAELIDGTLLEPGETFSLNDTVGERTAQNGFAKGFIISDGVFREDFGGGVSQVATTTFNAAFFAGLEDVEHKPHSFYIDRYPVGREATVAWGAVDLRFRNDTRYGVLISANVQKSTPSQQGAMNVAMYSTKVWDIKAKQSARYNLTAPATRQLRGPECVPNDGYGGFDIDVYRLFYKVGVPSTVERRERMHTTYTPSDSVVCSD